MAGLFVGCELASVCPKAALTTAAEVDEDAGASTEGPAQYRSPFTSWDERASVRTAPRRVLSDDTASRHLFAPDLVPLLQHSDVRALGPAHVEAAIAHHTFRYLHFTTVLESLVVNPVAGAISRGSLGLELPAQMRLDAHRIYCDEAYHALFSADLVLQIEERTGLTAYRPERPYFLDRLARIRADLEPSRAALTDLLFVICSEMLVTATLSEVQPRHDTEPAVYQAVRDHALDEGRHHAYFQQLLRHLWSVLPRSERQFAARIMPALVGVFMEPDVASLHAELSGHGFGEDDARRILADVFPPDLVTDSTAAAASHVVRSLRDLGAFEDAATRHAFEDAGLLLADAPGRAS